MNEQDRLARLVRAEEMEPMNTASMIEDFLKEKLGNPTTESINEAKRNIEASGDVVEQSGNRMSKIASASPKSMRREGSTEKVLLSLYDLRDELIGAFETSSLNTKVAERLTSSIRRSETCIRDIGGDVEEFVPLNHVSGLQAPNFIKNAEKVIETTLQCYTLGKIEEAKIKEDGKAINIIFSGRNNGVVYSAIGTVRAEEWMGNEAIDYIYTPNEGKMSVKAYENGRWIDKSSSGKYQVYWELEEKPINSKNEKTQKHEGQTVVADEIKEGEVNISSNKMVREQSESTDINDGEEDIGEPIK